MNSITVNDLYTTGVELFHDSESYLTEFNNLDGVYGGTDGATSSDFGVTPTIFSLVTKGYEFGVYTLGIEAIAHIVKSFSAPE